MRTTIKICLLAATFALPVAPALAKAPVGPRVELQAGSDHISSSGEDSGYAFGKSGVSYGLAAGYDFALSSGVSAGLDAEVAGSGTKYTTSSGNAVYTAKMGRDLYAGGRVSVGLGSAVNAYVKLGYANARATETLGAASVASTGGGLRIGIGGQVAFGKSVFGLVEYRHTKYQGDLKRDQVVTGLGLRF